MPPPIKLAVLPLIVHVVGVVLAKVTGLPEAPPVPAKVAVPPTTPLAGVAAKPVMVWLA